LFGEDDCGRGKNSGGELGFLVQKYEVDVSLRRGTTTLIALNLPSGAAAAAAAAAGRRRFWKTF
jgi:hypothetical protein